MNRVELIQWVRDNLETVRHYIINDRVDFAEEHMSFMFDELAGMEAEEK